jgi:hypothetical protein
VWAIPPAIHSKITVSAFESTPFFSPSTRQEDKSPVSGAPAARAPKVATLAFFKNALLSQFPCMALSLFEVVKGES